MVIGINYVVETSRLCESERIHKVIRSYRVGRLCQGCIVVGKTGWIGVGTYWLGEW